jgi:hypothetical protein
MRTLLTFTFCFLAAFGLPGHQALAQSWPLKLTASEGQEALVKTTGREHEISPGARVMLSPASDVPSDTKVLEFEFFCIGGVAEVSYAPADIAGEAGKTKLPAIDHSEGWSPYRARLDGGITKSGIMMTFGLEKDRVLQIRNIRVRTEVPGEFEAKNDGPRRSLPEEVVLAELQRRYPAAVTKVVLFRSKVEIQGRFPDGMGPVALAEIPIDRLLTDPECHLAFHPVTRSAEKPSLSPCRE